ncbi:long-chain fatty acid-CoA ligase [Boothiomyces macroporosus]|uniref:Long-chain fatty acid-CoA ligase n=1 Tax=Boothiomyces macroporosus TaxID=261099 RepID=A0AAD5UG25_9FUNG|nr:long-chain fatty acid-CoA ligase [Boothiomyces macroporosus]
MLTTYEVGEKTATAGIPRRAAQLPKGEPLSVKPHPSVSTVHDILLHASKKYPDSPLFGYRDVISIHSEDKEVKKVVNGIEKVEVKTWKYFELSEYKFVNYTQVQQKVVEIGAGLIKIGLKEKDIVNIFASTSHNWMTMTHACYSQNICISTSYDNLGADGLKFALDEGECSTIVTQPDLLPMLKKVIAGVPTLKNVIYVGNVSSEFESVVSSFESECPNVKLYSMDQVQQLGKENMIATNPPKAEDLCCIMYTSGSTGNPKGVMLSHANVVAGIAGIIGLFGDTFSPQDTYLAYLPLAHVLEFLVETLCMYTGVTIGYGSPKTLTDASVRNCKGDIRELRPTVMAGVPSVWETIKKGIMAKLNSQSPFVKFLFNSAFALKKNLMSIGLPHSFLDSSIFGKIAESTGGRLRLALSGGAPIAAETHEFLTVALCHIVNGYGMTESGGALGIQNMSQKGQYGNVGAPFTCTELKLVAANDYDPHGNPPRGEIWARGASITSGYFKNPQLTAETITEDGWLKTGDVGEWLPDGNLKIIDRVKNLVKLAHGEYVALEKLEAQYKSSHYVMNICVVADPSKSHIVALIVPNGPAMDQLATELGVPKKDYSNPAVIKAVGNDLADCAKRANFQGAEVLKYFTILHDEWTPENGMLTAAQKLKRKDIVSHYKDDIEKMYV